MIRYRSDNNHPLSLSGSAAAGVGDSVNDDTVQGVAKIVEKGAEKIKDDLEEERKKDDEDEDSDGDD